MDKKLLDSLSNFSVAIDNLVEELKKKETTKKESSGIFKGMFGVKGISIRLKRMEKSIKEIKEDTTQIIKNQDKLLSLQKVQEKEEKSNLFSDTGDKGQMEKIKEGVGSIILIAGAVLAIGLAFKLVGHVDVLSVIALGISIGIMGAVLTKLSENGIPSPKESLSIGLSLVSMTAGVVASSWLLMLIPDIKISQLVTFGAILLMFSALSMGMSVLIDAVKGIKPMDVIYLPLILIGISLAIMATSFILQHTQMIPYDKLLNIVVMGVALSLMALAMSIPLFIIGKMGGSILKGAILGIIILPAMSLAIMLSSHLIGMGDYSVSLPLGWVISFSLAMLVLAIPVAILGMIPLPLVLSGALALVIISAALVASSYILSYVKPDIFYTLSDAIEYFIDKVGGAVIRFAKDFLPILVDVATSFLTKILPPLKEFLVAILPPLANFLSTIIDSVMPAVMSIIDVAKVIVGEIDNIIIAISKVLDSIGGIIESVGNALLMVGEAIAAPINAIGGVIEKIGNAILGVINGITDSVERLSKLDGDNMLKVGEGLSSIAAGLGKLAAGGIAKGLSDLFTGGGVSEQLKDMSEYHEEIYKTGVGLDKLAKGIETLNNIEIEDEQINKVLKVLEKVGDLNSSISVDNVTTSVLDGTNLVNDIKSLADPQNEEMLRELRIMNQQLSQISSNSSTISSQLNNLGDNDEPKLEH